MTDFTGAGVKGWILAIVGNLFIVLLVVRAVSHYARQEWGQLLTSLAFAIVLVGMIYFPDQVISILKTVWSKG